jgi:hypothetical protein
MSDWQMKVLDAKSFQLAVCLFFSEASSSSSSLLQWSCINTSNYDPTKDFDY